MEEEEASAAELISPRISFSHDLATFAAAAANTYPTTPSRSDTPSFMSPRRRQRRRHPEPEFDFANAAADDVAPADRLFADGKLLPLPPLPPTPHARCASPAPAAWQQKTTRPMPTPRSWGSRFARSSSLNSAATASGRFTCPAFPLMRSRSVGGGGGAGVHHRPHCKKVAPATTTTTAAAAGVHNGGGPRSVYYYGHGSGRNGGGGVRVSPVLNVTSIGTSVVNMLSYLLCDCGEIKGAKNRGFGVNCWVTR
uniref:Uncharacterized protein n=1 Tax=Avena sativa TaxID=4498 RepID=A0ACD5VMA3_AVESA